MRLSNLTRLLLAATVVGFGAAGGAYAVARPPAPTIRSVDASDLTKSIAVAIASADAMPIGSSQTQRSAAIRIAIEHAIAESGADPKAVIASLNSIKASPLSASARDAVNAVITLVLALLDDNLEPTALGGGFLGGEIGLPPNTGGLGGSSDYRTPA